MWQWKQIRDMEPQAKGCRSPSKPPAAGECEAMACPWDLSRTHPG
jgi:hypothetical protein